MAGRLIAASLAAALRAGERNAWFAVMLSAVVAGALVSPRSAVQALRKVSLYALGTQHLLFSRDKKWKKGPIDPDELLRSITPLSTVRIVYIRHGESEWNDVFNKGFGPGFVVRLVVALVREALRLVAPDSVFVDSPLSAAGVAQAAALSVFLAQPRTEADGLSKAEAEAHALLRAGPGAPPSVLAASNLRRAIQTAGICLAERVRRTGEPMHILTSLQEISPNVDALSITPAYTSPVLPGLGLRYENSDNRGNKAVRGNGGPRMASFAAWAFERPGREAVVATGHSLWLRSFMDVYLPRGAAHDARRRKVANCAVVAFTLQRGRVGDATVYRIPPESIAMLYGGYH